MGASRPARRPLPRGLASPPAPGSRSFNARPLCNVNAKAKGTRAERLAIRILEAAGYVCTKAGASLGLFDVIAIGPTTCGLQVKAGSNYLSAIEREQTQALTVPAAVSRECWR